MPPRSFANPNPDRASRSAATPVAPTAAPVAEQPAATSTAILPTPTAARPTELACAPAALHVAPAAALPVAAMPPAFAAQRDTGLAKPLKRYASIRREDSVWEMVSILAERPIITALC